MKSASSKCANRGLTQYSSPPKVKKTEPAYFAALADRIREKRGGNIDVRVIGIGRGTNSLLVEAANLLSKSPYVYQHAWIVFDKDDFDDFDETIRQAEQLGFSVAWSNQAFEFWLYLHFDYSDSALHRSDWENKLDKLFKKRGIRNEGYEKNLTDIYHLVTENGNEAFAIGSAKSLHRASSDKKPSLCDPCTTVYQLVELMNRFL